MTFQQLQEVLKQKNAEIIDYARNRLPEVIGTEAVEEFRRNFERQAFDGKPWPEVERRKPDSPWYGFDYANKNSKPKYFSVNRTTDPILHGENRELRNAIRWRYEPGMVIVSNEKPYAAVHNFGGQAKIFGKHPFQMKQRQFMGVTKDLEKNIRDKMLRDLKKIINP